MELPLKNAKTLPRTMVHAKLMERADPASKDKPIRALENNDIFTITIAALSIIS